ncbi:Ni/Fe-hydrogenase, b-type cytochrome subunit [Terasakiella pusilla]|uniref:Ni/Fe-hydrogenase, b-type cytochrome subunit n=1 Tax=Terasakiella pusilla TaxID=64973 RepID=UPI003AA8A5DA
MSTKITAHKEEAHYIYEAPVRLWHWVNAFAIVALCITGYLIGKPFPSVQGEASDHYIMGYVRWIHFASAYILMVGFAGRVYWAFVGNKHARQIFLPPIHKLGFWQGVVHELLWYAFIVPEPKKYEGHNPLAALIMHFVFLWGMVFMILTGLALYGEGTGMDSWQFDYFSSWIIPLFGQSQDVHTWHRLVMWILICFAITHIYAALREDIMSRQSLIGTMISGWRTFKDSRKDD